MKLTTVILCVAIVAAAGVLWAQGHEKAGLRQVMAPNFENMNDMLRYMQRQCRWTMLFLTAVEGTTTT